MENFTDLLIEFGAIAVAIWVVTEVVGRFAQKYVAKDLIALLLGIFIGVAAVWIGWVTNVPEGVKGLVAGAIIGLFATATAGIGHDKLVKPMTKSQKKILKQ